MIITPTVHPTISVLIASVPTFSKLITTTPPQLKVAVSQPFDWLTFFWGGAFGTFVGAFIILGIERLWNFFTERIKSEKEKKQITHALNAEIQSNIEMCEQVITTISQNPAVMTFAKFEYLWIKTYSNKYIDFTNADSLRLYSFLFGARKAMDIIHDLQANLQMFSASSRALTSYGTTFTTMNQNILQNVQRLKTILEEIKNRRVENKMFNPSTSSTVSTESN